MSRASWYTYQTIGMIHEAQAGKQVGILLLHHVGVQRPRRHGVTKLGMRAWNSGGGGGGGMGE